MFRLRGVPINCGAGDAIPPAPTNQVPLAVRDQSGLTGQKQAMFQFSQYLESQIDNPVVKTDLMLRAHEAMNGSIAQGKLATDRVDAFMAEKRSSPTTVAPPGQPPGAP